MERSMREVICETLGPSYSTWTAERILALVVEPLRAEIQGVQEEIAPLREAARAAIAEIERLRAELAALREAEAQNAILREQLAKADAAIEAMGPLVADGAHAALAELAALRPLARAAVVLDDTYHGGKMRPDEPPVIRAVRLHARALDPTLRARLLEEEGT